MRQIGDISKGEAPGRRLMTRAEAIDLGVKRYYTGGPCKRGHYAERFTSNGGCTKCMADDKERVRRALGALPAKTIGGL